MVNDDPQIAIVVTQVSECLVDFALGSIRSTEMDPAHRIRCVAETLNHEDLWLTLHPLTPL